MRFQLPRYKFAFIVRFQVDFRNSINYITLNLENRQCDTNDAVKMYYI